MSKTFSRSKKSKKKSTEEEESDSGPDYLDPPASDSESDQSAVETRRMKQPKQTRTTLPKLPLPITMDAPTDECEPYPLINFDDMLQRDQLFSSPVRPLKCPDGYIFLVHMLSNTDCSNYKIRRHVNDHKMVIIKCDSLLKDKTVSHNCYPYCSSVTPPHSLYRP